MRGVVSCPLWSYQCNSGLPNFFDIFHEDIICVLYYLTSKADVSVHSKGGFTDLKRGDLGSLVLPDEHETIGMGHSGIESFGHIDS